MPPRAQRSSRRPRRARRLLLAAVVACGALAALPGAGLRGEVLDLVSDPGANPGVAAGQGPVAGASARPQASPAATAAPLRLGEGRPPARWFVEDPRPTAPPVAGLVDYAWPIAHPRLTLSYGPSPWGRRVVDGKLFHDGVDLATFCGDRIVAAHHGTVLAAGRRFDRFIGWVGDLGPYFARLDTKHLWMSLPITVVIDDGNGYRSVYAHFSRVVVKAGQHIEAGQLLGYEGATGYASGCHLHYSLFSPWEWGTFGVEARVSEVTKLPALEIARVDPLLVLPPKAGINAPATPRPGRAPGLQPVAGSVIRR